MEKLPHVPSRRRTGDFVAVDHVLSRNSRCITKVNVIRKDRSALTHHKKNQRKNRSHNAKGPLYMARAFPASSQKPKKPGWKAVGDEEALACFTPVWTWFDTLPTYGKFAFTDDKVLLTLLPRPLSTKIATTAMRARISAYSTKLWPFRDFNPRYIFRRVLFISFTSFIWLFRIAQRSNRLTFILGDTVAAYVPRSSANLSKPAIDMLSRP
jgi:hypothetical protein